MARLTRLIIEGFRSIQEQVTLDLPKNMPVVLIGNT